MIRSWLGLLVCGCALLLAACSPGEEEAPTEGEGTPNPLLYEIANADGEVEGWMLGTIHALPDGTQWRSERIERVISGSDLLLVEVANLDDREAIAAIFATLATTPDLGPLPPRVSPDLREPLGEMIARAQLPPSQFNDTESWAAAIMLAQVDALGKPRDGVDRAVIADFADREVRGFETAAEQLGIFDRLAPDDQRELLEGTIEEWAEARDHPDRLMQAWITGDVAVLEQATITGIMADPDLRAALLVERNRRWLPMLLGVLRGPERPLVAVGTAHLVGEDSLKAMLEAEGFTVTRIR